MGNDCKAGAQKTQAGDAALVPLDPPRSLARTVGPHHWFPVEILGRNRSSWLENLSGEDHVSGKQGYRSQVL